MINDMRHLTSLFFLSKLTYIIIIVSCLFSTAIKGHSSGRGWHRCPSEGTSENHPQIQGTASLINSQGPNVQDDFTTCHSNDKNTKRPFYSIYSLFGRLFSVVLNRTVIVWADLSRSEHAYPGFYGSIGVYTSLCRSTQV